MSQRDYSNARVICDWGNKHPINVTCNCYDTFGSAFRMQEWLKEKYPKVMYTSDITSQMRDQYVLECKPTAFVGKHKYITHQLVAQRNAWTLHKLQSLSKEELEGFKQEVIDLFPTAYAQGRIRAKLLKQFAYILIRKKHGCPY